MVFSKTSLFVLTCTLILATMLLLAPQHVPFINTGEKDTHYDKNQSDDSVMPLGDDETFSNYLPDLVVRNVSLHCEEGRIVKHMNNRVSVTVLNEGDARAMNVKVAAYIKYRDGDNLIYISNEIIPYLGKGEEKKIDISLFPPTVREAAVALMRFAGIEKIVIKVDPYNSIEEENEENNAVYSSVSYGDIFPRFSNFEDKIIGLLQEKRFDRASIRQTIMKIIEKEGNLTALDSL